MSEETGQLQLSTERKVEKKNHLSVVWKIVRICFALGALIFIVYSIQYEDVLISENGQQYVVRSYDKVNRRICLQDSASNEYSFDVISEPSGKRNVFELKDVDGLRYVFRYRPGAKSLARNMNIIPACFGIMIFGFVPIFLAMRWKTLLSVIGIFVTFFQALKLTFAGRLMNFFFISTTGGDLFKAYWVSRDKGKRAEAFVSVFVDRFLGLAFLILFSCVLVLLFWNDEHISKLVRPIGGLVLLLGIAVLVLFSMRVRRVIRFDKWKDKLPFSSVVGKIDDALLMFRSAGKALIEAGVYTAILQIASSVSTYFLGQALNINVSVWYFLLYVPLAFLIGSIPISIFWGLGLMEGAYVIFFAGSGFASPTQAAMLAMGARLVQLLWSLPGAIVLMSGLDSEELKTEKRITKDNTSE